MINILTKTLSGLLFKTCCASILLLDINTFNWSAKHVFDAPSLFVKIPLQQFQDASANFGGHQLTQMNLNKWLLKVSV